MESIDQLNAELADSVTKAELNNFQEEDVQKIIKCIKNGANPNYEDKYGRTLAEMAVMFFKVDLLKFLIRHKVNINKNDCCVLFKYINATHHPEILRELCDAGSSLIVSKVLDIKTVFHYLIAKEAPKESIETIITRARFDIYDREVDEELKQTVKTMLLVSNRLTLLPEIQWNILSNLALDYFYGFNKIFCKKLAENGYRYPLFMQLEKRVETIEKILQFPDQHGMTAAQWWKCFDSVRMSLYDKEKELLFDGTTLRKDMIEFKSLFSEISKIPKDNLILKMCEYS